VSREDDLRMTLQAVALDYDLATDRHQIRSNSPE
jgi:hypothetical protein